MGEKVQGLSTSEVENLQKQFGKNSTEVIKEKVAFGILVRQYKNFMSVFLLAATLFSYLIGDYLDAFFIFLFLVFNGFFGFLQEYRAEKTVEKLKEINAINTQVIRDGQEMEIDARDIVPGDTVVLREGSKIPADGILSTDVDIEVDESILTGESQAVEKTHGDTLYSGTFIVRGRGYLKVQSIGFETRLGQITRELSTTKKPEVPLATNISKLTKILAVVAAVLSFSLIPIGIVEGKPLNEIILTAVSVAVALIPEGLSLVVTVALAVGAYHMVKRKTIVRKMASIEALGSTSVILSDKTGTITQNKMTVKSHWVLTEDKMPLLLRAAVLGNTASVALEEDNGQYEVVGDPTDGALLGFVSSRVNSIEQYRTEGKVIDEKPFDPETKIIEMVWEENGVKHIFLRGAPETILGKVNHQEKTSGLIQLESSAKEGLRIIAFAHRVEGSDFELLGMVGLYDAPRPEAIKAIAEARGAGIRIVMVTGDNPITAKAIGEEIGLIAEGELILTHQEIENMTDEELSRTLPRVRIFARMEPEDKLRLVRLYKASGNIVAVTGDGVNDSLALSEAHVGVAMGDSGTDVAREAADIVITDDNLYTIVKAIEEGRGIFDNIIKVLMFLLSTNLTEFFLIFLSVIAGLPIPLNPTQILWINLIGDGAPAMALATDARRHGLLRRKPRNVNEPILNKQRAVQIMIISAVFSIFLMSVYYLSLNVDSISRVFVFNALVVGEMVVLFIIRGGIFPINRFMIVSVVVTLLLQLIISTVPELRMLFRM